MDYKDVKPKVNVDERRDCSGVFAIARRDCGASLHICIPR